MYTSKRKISWVIALINKRKTCANRKIIYSKNEAFCGDTYYDDDKTELLLNIFIQACCCIFATGI